MTNALIVSNVALWLAVLALGVLLMALVRQIGVLHERLGPAGALMIDKGPKVGEAAPIHESRDLAGEPVKIGGIQADQRSTLVFFLAPNCPVCKGLLPMLKSVAEQEADWLRLVFASDGDESDHRAFAEAQGLSGFPYLVSTELGMSYQIGKLPYAVILDSEGRISAKGLVNSREHIESLFHASELRLPSIQAWLERRKQADADNEDNGGVRLHKA
ncbi:methylamine dehydrogenase accessory protein MauD [Arhodomonas aquaeolei]|uniref:methylamine dehydrogenase accessory protein MauD n=1 Tax=Arhodomonas aquaeolei TaxID=2369 RepID=UPI0003662E82|nr:methylamine dehydrogenase accessory protein MauD [Arhodomonas aquaeolei]